jgi:3',5'-cyclic-nucleotide phosphodiesterase
MELRILGCHGGETPRHRTTSFFIDDRLAVDAGSLTRELDLSDQQRLDTVLITHAHLDHVRDLATISDNRCQQNCPPLNVVGTKETIAYLRAHFFNDRLWPDFTVIPSPDEPTIVLREIPTDEPTDVLGYRITAIPVNHTVECAAFIVEDDKGAIAISGDTGPTDEFWKQLNQTEHLKALLMDVSFPNRVQALASASGHHTPQTAALDLEKYKAPQDLPTLLYHIKPPFQTEVELECAKLKGFNLHIVQLDEHFIL